MASLGNTNLARTRIRNWFFTINNYTEDDIKSITAWDCKYTFQEEVGENGTPHLQGVVMFKDAKTLGAMKRYNARAHWEIVRSSKHAVDYCKKRDTSVGPVYSNMDIEVEEDRELEIPDTNEEKLRKLHEKHLVDMAFWKNIYLTRKDLWDKYKDQVDIRDEIEALMENREEKLWGY